VREVPAVGVKRVLRETFFNGKIVKEFLKKDLVFVLGFFGGQQCFFGHNPVIDLIKPGLKSGTPPVSFNTELC
jgi:hypothetical protein